MTMLRSTPFAAFAVVLAAHAPVTAQSFAIDRGSLLIDGQASFTSTGQEIDGQDSDDRFTQFALTPSVQFFVMPGLAIGGELLLARSSFGDEATWIYGVGPAVTYFFGAEERTWYPYVGANLSFAGESSDDDDEDTSSFGYRGAGGAVFMVARNVGINAELFYGVTEREVVGLDVETNQFGLAAGISVFVF